MYPFLRLFLFGLPLLIFMGCGSGEPPAGSKVSSNTVLFDPAASIVPLPNILATATAKDPMMNYSGNYGSRPANRPMTPPEALAYVNKYEMASTNAVAGLNAPIYIRFARAVDPTTVGATTVKVFQITADSASTSATENNPLTFTDVSGMFDYSYTAGSTDLYLFPKFPLLPATRYVYLVTSGVKDASSGGAVAGSQYFEALKSATPLAGSFLALEPIRANTMSGSNIKLSGYAKVMDDLIARATTTKITSRNDIALLGRFITTGAGFVAKDATGTQMPAESALRSFAAGATLGGLTGKTWTNTVSGTATLPPAVYWTAVGAGTAPATVASVVTGNINSAELSLDPVIVKANAGTMDLTAVTGAYNPAAGVVQSFRDGSGNLTGYYHTTRTVPFVYFVPSTPSGKVIIFQHGITGQKEQAVAVAGSLTAAGYAVMAIDLPLHGALAIAGHTTGSVWGQDFMAVGAPLATRSNIQQAAFNLDRLEFTLKTGGLVGAGITAAPPTEIKFAGLSLGSIVGTYYLAGNTTLATSGYPYTQTTLNSDMKGFLSVPGGRLAYLMKDSPAFSSSINAGLAAKGIAAGSVAYNQFFQVTQSVVDPVDPASMTTPLATGLPSRLSGRVMIQEAVGDQVIPNASTRYLGSALGGRGVLGSAGATVAPNFYQLGYRGAATPTVPSLFIYTLDANGALAAKVDFAARNNISAITPSEGYFQFNQTGINHGFLLDPTASAANTGYGQSQMVNYLLFGGVIDPTSTGVSKQLLKITLPAGSGEYRLPATLEILGY